MKILKSSSDESMTNKNKDLNNLPVLLEDLYKKVPNIAYGGCGAMAYLLWAYLKDRDIVSYVLKSNIQPYNDKLHYYNIYKMAGDCYIIDKTDIIREHYATYIEYDIEILETQAEILNDLKGVKWNEYFLISDIPVIGEFLGVPSYHSDLLVWLRLAEIHGLNVPDATVLTGWQKGVLESYYNGTLGLWLHHTAQRNLGIVGSSYGSYIGKRCRVCASLYEKIKLNKKEEK